MNERVFDFDLSGAPVSSPAARQTTVARVAFITYAVEIEGEAPLYFSIEAVDE
jgi:hypothetical protein